MEEKIEIIGDMIWLGIGLRDYVRKYRVIDYFLEVFVAKIEF
jgi:hypothetical protein